MRVLLIPFFATSHIEPFTDLAIRLAAAASPDATVEATVAVTPSNVSIVRSMLKRQYVDAAEGMPVKIATTPSRPWTASRGAWRTSARRRRPTCGASTPPPSATP
ncbi:hypothetical protein ZWY2020_013051 [Hordeum vulgare]|nr:hypothetical protein ZWY2020_013051 [Hordeum vulgare]